MPPDPPLPDVFSAGTAASAGLTHHAIAHRIRTGRWLRLRRGVFCRADTWSALGARARHLLLTRAELLSIGRGRVVSHESAAAAWGLPLPSAGLGPVWTTDGDLGRSARRSRDRVVEVASLRPHDVVLLDGLAVTAETRTVADCLRHQTLTDAVAVGDSALRGRLTTVPQIDETLRFQAGWPYVGRARAALPLLDPRRETPLESQSFAALWQCGIPLPCAQVYVYDAEGQFVAIVDALWIAAGLVGECDGRTKYDLDLVQRRDPEVVRSALLREKVREDRLRGTQLGVIRWGTWDVRPDLSGLARRVRAAMATGGLRRFTGQLRLSRSPSDVIDLAAYLR
ncbi:MAG TPA: hypothetical protein VKB14_05895 [Actinomycetales bacterium]|nr:hypothetical protein [Actinomycetales bacterium]